VALRAAGILNDEADLPLPKTEIYEPDPGRHAVYRSALDRQQALYAALLGL
jgi:hypothetical protein